MNALYNEIEPYPAEWLRRLAAAGQIADGIVDERSIVDLRPADVRDYRQVHFFAGIGGWSAALRLAGWPDDEPVWTGSCPCQPFSAAGRRKGFDDERHLWPVWFRLIAECRPTIIFGEQVGNPDGLKWLDAVYTDLENTGYTVGAADLPAASVGAPHIRQRLHFVAVADGKRCQGLGLHLRKRRSQPAVSEAGGACKLWLGDTGSSGSRGDAGAIPDEETQSERERVATRSFVDEPGAAGATSTMGDADQSGRRRGGSSERRQARDDASRTSLGLEPWADVEWIECVDGKTRPIEPGTFPLAYGLPNRVGRLRAYGNAIVPQVAATFIQAVIDIL